VSEEYVPKPYHRDVLNSLSFEFAQKTDVATPAPAPLDPDRGSSPSSLAGAATAAGSPACLPAGIPAPRRIADGRDCADPG